MRAPTLDDGQYVNMFKKVSLVSIVAAVSFVIVPSGAFADDHNSTSDSSVSSTPARTDDGKLAKIEARQAAKDAREARMKAEKARREDNKVTRAAKIAQEQARRQAAKDARETKMATEKARREDNKVTRAAKIAQEQARRQAAKDARKAAKNN